MQHTIGKPARRYIVVLIMLMSIIAYVDRQVISVLVEPIKHDLQLTDTQVGLLTGVFFSGVFILAAFPLARLADTGSRRKLAAWCIAGWSIATACCGMATSYAQIALGRSLVAVGEGGAAPTSASLVGDLFGPLERSRIFALMSCGSAIGIAFGIYAGGTLNEHLGWRGVFVALSVPGLLLAIIIYLTMPEPPQPPQQAHVSPTPFATSIAQFVRIRSYRSLIAVAILASVSAYAVLAWYPAFLIRVHHLSTSEVGIRMGTATVLGLLSGNLLCGYITHRMAQRDVSWLILTVGIGLITSVPAGFIMLWSDDLGHSLIGFGFFMSFMGFWSPPVWTIAVGLVTRDSRALIASTIPLYQAIGGAIGPWVVGMGNDYLAARYGAEAIRYSLVFALGGAVLAAIIAFASARFIRADYRVDDGSTLAIH